MTPRLLALLVAVVLACSSQAACAQENVLNVGKYGQLSSYDPHAGALDTMWWTLNNFYESLVDLNDDISGLRPVLATAWQVAPSGKIYTLTLRSGVKFNDGTAFDAAAVKLSVERAQALKKAASLYVKPIVKVETPSPTTVVFHLDKPNNAFLAGLRFLLIVSPKAVHDNDKGGDNAEGWLRDHTAGTGPYTLEKWEPNIIHVARKNPGYWRGWPAGKFTTLNLRHIYEPETQRLMIEKGELDIAENVTKDSLRRAQAQCRADRVREGRHHADGDLPQHAGRPHEGPPGAAGAASPLEPGGVQRHHGQHRQRRPPVPAAARARLEDGEPLPVQPGAGQAAPRRGRLSERRLCQLRYQSQKGDVDKRAMFEIFQAELTKLNVTVELLDDTWPALVKRATDWGATRDAGTAVHMFGYFRPMFIPTPYDFLFQMYHSEAYPTKGGRNFTYYTNPEYDRLINDSVVSLDAPREQRQLRQAAELLWKDAAVVVNGRIVDKIVTRKDVKGFIYQGDRISYRYWDMSRER